MTVDVAVMMVVMTTREMALMAVVAEGDHSDGGLAFVVEMVEDANPSLLS